MIGLIFALALVADTPQQTQPPAAAPIPAPAATKLSTKTPLSILMANPQARDIVRKHLPDVAQFLEGAGASQAPSDFTLESLSAIPRAGVTPEKLQAINQDLGKL